MVHIVAAHWPLAQICPAWQTVPQAPQLFLSDWVLKHPFVHEVVPVGHAQTPLLQFAPVLHAVLQVPQWLGSVWRETHWLPHNTCPPLHVGVPLHTPATQVWPDWQDWPQAPQLFASVAVLTHEPPQLTWPAGHEATVQTPETQDWPAPQTVPHAPQLFGSFIVLTHEPAHTICPVAQLLPPGVQAPLMQGTVLAHAAPQAPQFEGSEEGVVQI